MKLQVVYYGNPILRKKAAQVETINDEIKTLVADMFETMDAYNGIGIAAPQVNRSLAIFVMRVPHYKNDEQVDPGIERVFINPKILEYSDHFWVASEGCLSIPKLYGDVERPVTVRVEALNLNGEKFVEELTGWEARCVLHENDHINGKLFIDRLSDRDRKEFEPLLKKLKKQYHH